jgi:LysM repeat protein
MKTKFLPAVSPRCARKPLFSRLQTRVYRLPAHVTREDDWKADSPHIKLSRVFGIVLGIHLVAIGGLMAYEMFRHKDGATAATPAMKPALRETRASAPPSSPAATRAHATPLDDPANARLAKHVVGPGEKLGDIAERYQVEETALLEKNRIDRDHPFESGMKLVIPDRPAAVVPTEDSKRLLANAAVTPAPARELPPARPAAPAATAPPAKAMAAVEAYSPNKPVRKAEPVRETRAAETRRAGKTPAPPATLPAARKSDAAGKKSTPAKAASTPPPPKGRMHVVKEGENAYRIARSYGVDVDKLVRANGIKPDALRPGTTLVIPALR